MSDMILESTFPLSPNLPCQDTETGSHAHHHEQKFTEDNSVNIKFTSHTLDAAKKLMNLHPTVIEGNTEIADIKTSQKDTTSKNKDKTFLRKLRARINEKIVCLEKALDSYGVIDTLLKKGNEYEIQARIYDLDNHEMLDRIVFSSNEFTESDRKKLVEDAIFYWYVGMERTLSGQERRVSSFRLRRTYNPQSTSF